jgi:Ca-activated chloride channel family protein
VRATFARAVALALCAFVLVACGRQEASAPAPAAPQKSSAAFSILAGSELKELEAAIVDAARSAGVDVKMSYAGTLDIVERVNGGERFDAILPPNGAYPALALAKPAAARDKLFYSRVALGVKASKAGALGWDRNAPSWAEIARAAGDGKLRYAMTNPAASNTGMSALFAVASAVAGKTEDLRAEEVDARVLKSFLAGQKLTAGSSGWLAEAFVKEVAQLDAMVNYEAVILQTNTKLSTADRLLPIYPRDGVISADYPLMLLNAERRDDYAKLVQALKAPAFQRDALARVFLRPSNPEAAASPQLPSAVVSELAFPNSLDVIDAVLGAYQGQWRRPATSILVLDVSGSMKGPRLDSMREALLVLGGANPDRASSRYARFQDRERVVLITFSNTVSEPKHVRFEQGGAEAARADVRRFAEALVADGGTAIYSALSRAQQIGREEARREPDRFVSILLLTDGENNAGMRFDDFRSMLKAEQAVRVFPILFGEGNVGEMQELAQSTGGRVFDARKSALAAVFKEIRGYQ